MMGILGSLFGDQNTMSKMVDGVYNGVDKIVYTDEEKADNFQKLLKLYEPFKIAQRFLALIFGIPYVLAWLVTFIVSFFNNVDPQLALLNGTVGQIVLAIIAFYFMGGTISSIGAGRKQNSS